MSERDTALLLAMVLYGFGVLAGGVVLGIPEGDGVFASASLWAPLSALLTVLSTPARVGTGASSLLGYLSGFLIVAGVPAYWAIAGACVATGRQRLAQVLLGVHYASAPVLFAMLYRAAEPRYRDRFITTATNDIEVVLVIVAWYFAGQVLLWWWMRMSRRLEDGTRAAVG